MFEGSGVSRLRRFPSTAESDAQIRIRTELSEIVCLVMIDVTVDRTEEFVGTVAEANLGVVITERKACHQAKVWHCGNPGAIVRGGVRIVRRVVVVSDVRKREPGAQFAFRLVETL